MQQQQAWHSCVPAAVAAEALVHVAAGLAGQDGCCASAVPSGPLESRHSASCCLVVGQAVALHMLSIACVAV